MTKIKFTELKPNVLVPQGTTSHPIKIIRKNPMLDQWFVQLGEEDFEFSLYGPHPLEDAFEEAEKLVKEKDIKIQNSKPVETSEIFASMMMQKNCIVHDFTYIKPTEIGEKGVVILSSTEGHNPEVTMLVVDNTDPEDARGIEMKFHASHLDGLIDAILEQRKVAFQAARKIIQDEVDIINWRRRDMAPAQEMELPFER